MAVLLDTNLPTCTVHGTYVDDGIQPMSGSVTFTPSTPFLLNADESTVIYSSGFTATLDTTGSFSINLVATDTALTNPTGFTYTVSESLLGINGITYTNTYSMTAKQADSPINIADVVPVIDFTGTPIVRGRPSRQLVIQPTNPGLAAPGLWIQTQMPGGGFTFWLEDGT